MFGRATVGPGRILPALVWGRPAARRPFRGMLPTGYISIRRGRLGGRRGACVPCKQRIDSRWELEANRYTAKPTGGFLASWGLIRPYLL